MLDSQDPHKQPIDSIDDYEDRLLKSYGAVVGGSALTKVLGYSSQDAFRKAFQRQCIPVPTFEIEGRRGRFATTIDIARWLWRRRQSAPAQTPE